MWGFEWVKGMGSLCIPCLRSNISDMAACCSQGWACAQPAVLRGLPHLNALLQLGNGLCHCLEASRLLDFALLQERTASSWDG